MSLESWKTEFYDVPADKFVGTCDQLAAAQHSLKKWLGLRQENLDAHDITIHSVSHLIDASNCALCAVNPKSCATCSLFEVRGGFTCDEDSTKESLSPFHAFKLHSNQEPMIDLLKEAISMLEKKHAEDV
jgi:hypothetical protein